MGCEQTRQLAAELALGITDGADRARALHHLAECAECRRAVEELSAVTDGLLLLAPAHQPPVGFESRVLALLQPPRTAAPGLRRRRRGVLAAVAAAAVAAALAAAIVLGATSDDRRLADHYRAALATAHGSDFEAARLRGPAQVPAGVVYGYRGRPSWIFVAIYRPYRSTTYAVELAMTSGRRIPLSSLRLDPRTGSAGQAIPVDLHQVAGVRLVGAARGDVLEARLPHADAP
jgi:Putative zinc-finger